MVRLGLSRRIVDTLNKRVLVSSREMWGGLRRIDKTCDMGVGPLMAGLIISGRS
jgi:hypothetical protein